MVGKICYLKLFTPSATEMSANNNLSTPDLLGTALKLSTANASSEERWACVYDLHQRCELEIFEQAKTWCSSNSAAQKILAVDILSQLGKLRQEGEQQLRPYTDRSVPLLEKFLDDPDSDVVLASVNALAQHYAPNPIVKRSALARHPSNLVRKAVAQALGAAENPHATKILIGLSRDEDADVRDWATFGLGYGSRLELPEVAEALIDRLNDSHFDTRSEAMVGLGKRGDERVLPFIKAALEAEIVGQLAVEAAGEIASSELVGPLEALIGWWDVDTELLDAALERCRGVANPEEEWRWDNPANNKTE
jgi:HEAT repeat protein